MRRIIIAGNWKMNGSLASIRPLLAGLRQGVAATGNGVDIAVFPPYIYLAEASSLLTDTVIKLGAQNLAAEASGAFTGEVSGTMLKDYNCAFVIVGHSERRTLYGESDEVVARKVALALGAQLMPILCVGETETERAAGQTQAVIERQLDAVLSYCGVRAFAQAVVAYEPVWAIGTGKTASPAQAQEIHAAIRARIAQEDRAVAECLPILYGGSMKASNAGELLGMNDIDGGLIGGAALVAEEFLAIYRAGVATAESRVV
jgi:triosephosphate isomerase (TIM)